MTNKPLTFISLFAGIGGFDLALERAGLQCVAQVEIDSKARAVLHHHWPSVPQFEDVSEVGAHNLPPADVICGGFPCQDLSVAGKRAGFAGQRSVLFYEMTRIVNELRPAFLIWENVPGLLSSRGGADFHGVLTELDSIGYFGAWSSFDSQFFGLAQRRRRVFGVFARADIGAGRCAEILSLAARLPGHSAPRRGAGPQPAGEVAASAGDSGAGTTHTVAAPLVARQAKGGFTDPVSDNIIAVQEQGGFGLRTFTDIAPTLQAESGSHQGAQTRLPMVFQQNQHNDGGDHKRADRPNGGLYVNPTDTALTVGTTDLTVIAQAVDIRNLKMQPGEVSGTVQSKKTGGHSLNYLNPVMVENAPQADNDAQAKAGDSAPVVAFALRGRDEGARVELSGEATSSIRGSQGGSSRDYVSGVGVRRLTPVECERLQGFPDNWTANQADSTRYRQLGNAVAVPVVEWIARRLVAHYPSD